MLEALAADAPDLVAADLQRSAARMRGIDLIDDARERSERNPADLQMHQAYNSLLYRLGRKDDAQRERAIVDRLNAEAQAKQKGKGQ